MAKKAAAKKPAKGGAKKLTKSDLEELFAVD